MLSKIIKTFVLVLTIIILLLAGLRNYVLKFYLENYVSKSLKAECKVKKANLSFDYVSLQGVSINAKDFNVTAKNVTIKFKAQKEKPFLYPSAINLADISLKISSLENLGKISGKKSVSVGVHVFAKPLSVNLQNININLKSKLLELGSTFSIRAEIGPSVIFIKDANAADLDIHSQDFDITDLNLKKFSNDIYLLKISNIRIKDKKFVDFSVPVKSSVNQLLFPRAKNPFLGPDGFVSAKCDFSGYDSFCITIKLQDASFEKIVDIFASEEAAFRGSFDGELTACVSSFKISEIEAGFRNKGNGFINVKKESSFVFLKTYLDAASYNALIDNFKNYEYNIGIVSVKKMADILNLNLDFTSDAMGRRNITVNLHDILGNEK